MNEIKTDNIQRCIEICMPYDKPLGSDKLTANATSELDELIRVINFLKNETERYKQSYNKIFMEKINIEQLVNDFYNKIKNCTGKSNE